MMMLPLAPTGKLSSYTMDTASDHNLLWLGPTLLTILPLMSHVNHKFNFVKARVVKKESKNVLYNIIFVMYYSCFS